MLQMQQCTNYGKVIVNGQEFYISANLGIAVYPADGEKADELIKNANIAMYKSKEKGKNHFAD